MANEYKKTTNLPNTGFPMRASLAQNEPQRLADWDQNNVYELLMKKNEGHDKFVLSWLGLPWSANRAQG